jgi:hypothetical protein
MMQWVIAFGNKIQQERFGMSMISLEGLLMLGVVNMNGTEMGA